MEPKWELKSTQNQNNLSTECFEWQMVPRTDPGRRPRETVPPPKVIFRPESGAPKADPGTNGAPKWVLKSKKMQWEKTFENRCRKSVENHGKMARELWPNAW